MAFPESIRRRKRQATCGPNLDLILLGSGDDYWSRARRSEAFRLSVQVFSARPVGTLVLATESDAGRHADDLCFIHSMKTDLPNHPQDVHHREIEGSIESFELAFRMQREAPETLDLRNESQSTLDLFGVGEGESDRFARQCLLARRLAEAGVRFVEITAPTDWDHHSSLAGA